MSLKADLDILGKLATTLHGYAQDAAGIKVKDAPDPKADNLLESAKAAGSITTDVVYGALIETAKQRLDETATVMTGCVKDFKNMDDTNYDSFVNVYNTGTGDWAVGQGQ
ncbi:hypothetical protein GPX89_02400 [Nocardia sp. ET3-3]|uniref:ESX-1 secretion-associated protein n=1 Tax=Nocardia terrae TaxID=2675851 RepID=A0A7K1UP25_9NOCA|nr:hypothetical protein [Nocardia terrae]MVU76093.1 hypothetical protein [Nocardia terrae]